MLSSVLFDEGKISYQKVQILKALLVWVSVIGRLTLLRLTLNFMVVTSLVDERDEKWDEM